MNIGTAIGEILVEPLQIPVLEAGQVLETDGEEVVGEPDPGHD
jgi:hypothetical protein